MSNQASFVVRLIDRITRPARAITAALKRIEEPLKRIQKHKAFQTLDRAADRALGWAKTAAIGISAAGAAIGAITVGMTVNMARFAESSRLAFRYLYGGAAAGNVAFNTSVALAQQLGQDVETVTGQFVKLRAAQFTLGESKEVFLLAADLKALTGDAEAAKRAVTAITQIKAKGRLQSEELVGQLAEAGVSTVLVYESLGRTLGKTTAEVRALIEAGAVGSDMAIAAIKDAVKHKIGEGALGDFAKTQSLTTLGGAMDRLSAAPKLFFLRVAQTAQPAMKQIKASVESVIAAFGGLDTVAFADFVSKIVALLPAAIDLVREFAAGFGSGFSEVIAGLGNLNGLAGDQKQVWFDFGRMVAKGFGLALAVVKLLAQGVAFLDTPAGKAVASLGGLVLLFPKLIAAASAIASAWGAVAAVWSTVASAIAAALPVIGSVLGTIASVVGGVFTALAAVLALPVEAVVAIVAAVIAAGVAIYAYWDEIMAFFVGAEAWLEDAGGRMIEGLVNGLLAGWTRVKGAVVGIAQGIVGTVKSVLAISSPSRVMRDLGESTVEGFRLGLQTGAPDGTLDADAAVPGSALADAAQSRAAATQRVVQHNRFNITVSVGVGAKMREVRTAVAEGVRQGLDKSGEFAGT